MIKSFSLLLLIMFCNCLDSFSQTDTTIDNNTYEIIEKFNNGKIKQIGQFHTNCLDDTLRKHGYFIFFDEDGNEIDKKLYFYDKERNRKVLGLKHGWWGWYGITRKYFLGISISKPFSVSPCF